jgi:hypothetical protein
MINTCPQCESHLEKHNYKSCTSLSCKNINCCSEFYLEINTITEIIEYWRIIIKDYMIQSANDYEIASHLDKISSTNPHEFSKIIEIEKFYFFPEENIMENLNNIIKKLIILAQFQ